MSITAGNAVAVGNYPTATGQVLASTTLSGIAANVIYGTAEVVLDGSLTQFDVNFIDGTKTLSFTPTCVMAQRIESSAATDALSTITITRVTRVSNVKFTVDISAAGTNTHKLRLIFFAF